MLVDAHNSQSFTILDWVGTVIAGCSAVGLLMFPVAGRSFATMFQEFGSPEHLPALTRCASFRFFECTCNRRNNEWPLLLCLATWMDYVRRSARIRAYYAQFSGACTFADGAGFAIDVGFLDPSTLRKFRLFKPGIKTLQPVTVEDL